MSTKRAQFLEYEGSNYLRQRLVLATLTGRAIRINKIRCESCEHEYEYQENTKVIFRPSDRLV